MRRIVRYLTDEHREQVKKLEWVADFLSKKEYENKHVGNATDIDDLKQVAFWGICAAVYDWKPNGGKAIHSYAWDRAQAYIGHYMRDKSRLIKIPRAIQKVYYGYVDYTSKNPDKPIEDILFKLECTEDQLYEAKKVGVSTPFQLYSETLHPEVEKYDDPNKFSIKLKALAIVADHLSDTDMNLCLNFFDGKLRKASDQQRAQRLISSLEDLLKEENITLDTLDE